MALPLFNAEGSTPGHGQGHLLPSIVVGAPPSCGIEKKNVGTRLVDERVTPPISQPTPSSHLTRKLPSVHGPPPAGPRRGTGTPRSPAAREHSVPSTPLLPARGRGASCSKHQGSKSRIDTHDRVESADTGAKTDLGGRPGDLILSGLIVVPCRLPIGCVPRQLII